MDRARITQDSFEEPSAGSRPRPLSSILQEIGTRLTEILRSEVRLARLEVQHDIRQVAKASIILAVGVVLALYGFGFMLMSVVYAIAQTLPVWAAALTVGGGLGILAAIVTLVGRKKMQLASLRPDKTIQSVQVNVTWLKKQTK